MSQESPVIMFYMDKYYMFDNFSAFAIAWRDKLQPTVEHAYQAAKFDDENIIKEIHEATSAHESKKIAHKYLALNKGSVGWQDAKVQIMRELIRLKADQHPYVMEKLLSTKGSVLVEDSPTDSFWGRGPDHHGENWLGKLWMEYRDELLAKVQKFF